MNNINEFAINFLFSFYIIMSSNIYFLLLILFILVVIIITLNLKKTLIEEPVVREPMVNEPMVREPMVNEPMVNEPMVREPMVNEPMVNEPMVREHFFSSDEGQLIDFSKIKDDGKTYITKIDVIKENNNKRFPNRHLLIQGTNLDKVTDIFFADLKGIKLYEPKEISSNSNNVKLYELRILPPDFSNYGKGENIEIKLQIDKVYDKEQLQINGNYYTKNLKGTLRIDNKRNKIQPGRIKLEFELNVKDSNNSPKLIFKLNDKEYELEEAVTTEFAPSPEPTPSPTPSTNYTIYFDLKDSFTIDYEIMYDKKLFVSMENVFVSNDEVSLLQPTGLFYRHNFVTAGNSLTTLDTNDWNVYLSDRIKQIEDKEFIAVDDVKNFYNDIKKLTIPPPAPEKEILSFKVEDVTWEEVADDDTINRISWTKPKDNAGNDTINNFRFAFLINIKPKVSNDRFSLIDEQINFEKTSFDFPTNKLTPGNEYEFSVSTYRTDKQVVIEKSIDSIHTYRPKGFDDYHSHLFDPETQRFKENLTQDQPELIKTYYQLLAANKIKMQNEMDKAHSHIEAESQCIAGNLDNLQTKTSNDAFDENLQDQLKKGGESEKIVFDGKQKEQNEQIDRVNEKIAELEKIQGKLKKVQNTNIKRLTSQKDGTELSVKKLKNNKFMVGLNRGCLAVDKNSEYKYIPCNVFDKKQYFDLDTIENDDEYNNLLLMNRNSKLSKGQKVNYPFTVLKPNKSTKCVYMKDRTIQIKPCNDDESIRYTSHFYQNDNCKAK